MSKFYGLLNGEDLLKKIKDAEARAAISQSTTHVMAYACVVTMTQFNGGHDELVAALKSTRRFAPSTFLEEAILHLRKDKARLERCEAGDPKAERDKVHGADTAIVKDMAGPPVG